MSDIEKSILMPPSAAVLGPPSPPPISSLLLIPTSIQDVSPLPSAAPTLSPISFTRLEVPAVPSTYSTNPSSTNSSAVDLEEGDIKVYAKPTVSSISSKHGQKKKLALPTFLASFVTWFNIRFPVDRPIYGFSRNNFFLGLAGLSYLLLASIVAISVAFMPLRDPAPADLLFGPHTNNTQNPSLIPDDFHNDTTNLPLPENGDIYVGDATYYNPALGSCGITNSDNDPIVAIAWTVYDASSEAAGILNPNLNPLCGRKIRAKRWNEKLGKEITVEATVVDRCTGCKPTDLDFSPYLFKKLAAEELGRVDVTWAWI